eukprot:5107303-Prymnesium_polylepis.1
MLSRRLGKSAGRVALISVRARAATFPARLEIRASAAGGKLEDEAGARASKNKIISARRCKNKAYSRGFCVKRIRKR